MPRRNSSPSASHLTTPYSSVLLRTRTRCFRPPSRPSAPLFASFRCSSTPTTPTLIPLTISGAHPSPSTSTTLYDLPPRCSPCLNVPDFCIMTLVSRCHWEALGIQEAAINFCYTSGPSQVQPASQRRPRSLDPDHHLALPNPHSIPACRPWPLRPRPRRPTRSTTSSLLRRPTPPCRPRTSTSTSTSSSASSMRSRPCRSSPRSGRRPRLGQSRSSARRRPSLGTRPKADRPRTSLTRTPRRALAARARRSRRLSRPSRAMTAVEGPLPTELPWTT
jgi:hypothetical protein